MKHKILSWKIGGPAGFGIKVTGQMMAKSFLRAGFNVFAYTEYPSLVRGGHNTYQVEIAEVAVASVSNKVDLLVALDEKTVNLHLLEINERGCLVYDANLKIRPEIIELLKKNNIQAVAVPLNDLARAAGGNELYRNTVALGATLAIFGTDLNFLKEVIQDTFKKRETEVAVNWCAAREGYKYIEGNFKKINKLNLSASSLNQKIFISGNEAVALGAIAAGCRFLSAYPMTPATAILHYFAEKQKEADLVVRQTEDEIASIHAAIGASFAGARAMTCTSGGGFALMNEGLSLAGMTETPVVVVNAQRPAPATGLPTWTDQGDLNFVLNAGHGEFPRLVLAPGDVEEAFYLTAAAFNWAEKYQLPVIILTDKYLGESSYTADKFNLRELNIERGLIKQAKDLRGKVFKRYEFTKSGVSPRVWPGTAGGVHLANSDEHDELGFSIEGSEMRTLMMDKRMKKLQTLAREMPAPSLYGPAKASLTIIGWGSVKGSVLDALNQYNSGHLKKVNFLHFTHLWPLNAELVEKSLLKAKKLLLVENNYGGQLGGLLRREIGADLSGQMLKYDGRPFFRQEVLEAIEQEI